MEEGKLIQKLRDLEALFAGATTPGERAAAGHARERILDRLRAFEKSAPAIEYKFSMVDLWSKQLFLALLRRYQLKPYRYRGQRHTTVMVKVPKPFVDQTLWPQFERASAELRRHLNEVASQVIEQALDAKGGEVEEREQTQGALRFAASSD
ncbi:MAG TPA: hypothetical protein VFX59_07465 [Polyangiales bacterium]|nr:hypothetical protein [Polyangiales bacterium]